MAALTPDDLPSSGQPAACHIPGGYEEAMAAEVLRITDQRKDPPVTAEGSVGGKHVSGASPPVGEVAVEGDNPTEKMPKTIDTSSLVTYNKLLGLLLTSAAAICSAGWVAWQVHSAQPHNGAVHQRELDKHVQHYREEIRELRAEMRGLRNKLDGVESKIDQLIARP